MVTFRVSKCHCVLLGSLLLAGCATTPTAPLTAVAGPALRGGVHGGQQPIAGAHVYLLAAGTTGYGQASVSLLDAAVTGAADSVGAYVTTGPDGIFSITGDYACTPGTQVYLYTLGGNPGGGINPAAGLMAALGSCPASGSFLGVTPRVWINEVSTVAAAYAIAGFATDATHVSSSGTALAQVGIANAFANATNLAALDTGTALDTTPAGNGYVPQYKINLLANILTSCVNSTGPATSPGTPTTCDTLFQTATSDGTTGGVTPTDTATAAINIAHHPTSNTAALFNLASPMSAFTPTGLVQPFDLTISLFFRGGGYNSSTSTEVAIDSQGNAWFTNATGVSNIVNDIVKLSPLGVALSPNTGFTGGGLDAPHGIAIDNEDNVWVGNSTYFSGQGSLTKLTNAGVPIAGSPFTGGDIVNPGWLAVDGTDNLWFTSVNHVSEASSSGVLLSPAGGYTGGGIFGPHYLAFDAAEEVVVVDTQGVISKLTSAGAPAPGFPITLNLVSPGLQSAAIDNQGNILIGNSNPGNVFKFTNGGAPVAGSPITILTGSGGEIVTDGASNVWVQNHNRINEVSADGQLLTPNGFETEGYETYGLAVDGSGNIWTTAPGTNAMQEILGAATPVVTPIAAAVKHNSIGSRP